MSDQKLTGLQLVRQYFPLANCDDAHFILWNTTAYPFCDLATVRFQLHELAERCGPVRKHGWLRKVYRRAAEIEREIMTMAKESETQL